jgi:hypothetical protein
MAPETTRLKVRPQLPVLVGLSTLLILGAAARARTKDAPAPARLAPGVARTEPSPASPVLAVTPPMAVAEPSRTPVPTAPAAVDDDLRMLQEWILSLPTADLRALDGTGELNRRLAQIVAELAKRNGGELDRFLAQVNARLGVVPP